MASGVYSIPKDFAISVQDKFIEELRDKYPSGLIPVVGEDGEPYVSRIPYMESEEISMGVQDWNADQAAASARLRYLDVDIAGRQIKLAFSSRDLRRSGPAVIGAKTQTIMSKYNDEIDNAKWHGNYEGNVKVGAGIIEQLADVNTVITESQGTAQLVYANMIAMIQKIAPQYRSLNPIVFIMDWKSYDLVSTGIATGFTVSALEVFKKAYPSVFIFPTDTILETAANKIGGTDVVGTNGRMLCFAQNPDVIREIRVKAASPAGPALVNLTGNVDQLWGALWGMKVIQATGTAYTGTVLTF